MSVEDDNRRLDNGRIDPAKIDPKAWDAGVDEWLRHEGGSMDNIPLEAGAWDALLRRRLDRIESGPERRAVARYIRRRRRKLVALFEQEKAAVLVDAAAINKAQAVYDKRRDELLDSLEPNSTPCRRMRLRLMTLST